MHQRRGENRGVLEVRAEGTRLRFKRSGRPAFAGAVTTSQIQPSTLLPGDIQTIGIGPVPRPDEIFQHSRSNGTTRRERGLATNVVIRVAIASPWRHAQVTRQQDVGERSIKLASAS